MQFFKPENYFTVREALIEAERADLISGCEGLIPANSPREAIEARRRRANQTAGARRTTTTTTTRSRTATQAPTGGRARPAEPRPEDGLPAGQQVGAAAGKEESKQ